ncbi:MAG TPA: response regulator, partial [Hydrogenophaga sp.]
LVEHMGGSVGFKSTEGKGSCFYFDLPITNSESSFARLEPLLTQLPSSPRVLVVEDDLEVSRVLSIMLSRAGYAVDVVATGSQALLRCHQNSYDAITLDLVLPDISGVEVMRRVREQPANVNLPIVVVAAEVAEGRLVAPKGIKGVHWLSKPIDQEQLINVLRSASLRKRNGHRRILHVEDDRALHDAVCAMVGDQYDFELATTMREAKARVALERFDVVLLDLTMSEESGWDLLPIIRTQQPDAKVVILTASSIKPHERDKVDAVLQKTQLTPRTLIDAMSRADTHPAALSTLSGLPPEEAK